MSFFQRLARVFNRAVTPALRLPVVRSLVGGSMTELSYTGRKSGREFRLPVAYRRRGDEVTVAVAMPDRKSWWRNFTGEGARLGLTLDGRQRSGHAVSTRDEQGRVLVRIALDAA